jgi:[CysO sulfur-carrier protein]-S-L-cysteine hydrolase
MKLPRDYYDEIIAHAREDAPNECCGIIAGSNGDATKLYRAINAAASPFRYEVQPKDLLRINRDIDDHDWDVFGIYHSHTHTQAYPSGTDVRLAFYPEAYYILVSLGDPDKPDVSPNNPDVRAYRIVDEKVTEETIEIV